MALLTLAAFSLHHARKKSNLPSRDRERFPADFAGQNADPQIITVCRWRLACKGCQILPTWLSVSPTTGTGTTDVTISVTDIFAMELLTTTGSTQSFSKAAPMPANHRWWYCKKATNTATFRIQASARLLQWMTMPGNSATLRLPRVRVQAWCLQTDFQHLRILRHHGNQSGGQG